MIVRMSINPAARALAETGGTVGLADFFGDGRREEDGRLGVDGVGVGTAEVSDVEDGAAA
jgi:hypothetical protein